MTENELKKKAIAAELEKMSNKNDFTLYTGNAIDLIEILQENADELMKIEDVNVAFYKTGLLNVLNAMWKNTLNYYYLKEKRTIEIPADKIISVNKRKYELKENLEISVNIIRYVTAINTETCAVKVKCLPIKTTNKRTMHVNGSTEQRIILKMSAGAFIRLILNE